MLMSGCLQTTKPTLPKKAPAVRIWWGNSSEIEAFLKSPNAQSERWLIQAVD
jgi:hypothetical protein